MIPARRCSPASCSRYCDEVALAVDAPRRVRISADHLPDDVITAAGNLLCADRRVDAGRHGHSALFQFGARAAAMG